ncbi:MAG: hypothetical protein ACON39_03710 [Coraliomargaritaceae bacterium]
MSPVLQNIARENFRSSGYISHPVSEPPSHWCFVKAPSSPFSATDTLQTVLQRRVQAQERTHPKRPSLLRFCLNVILRR